MMARGCGNSLHYSDCLEEAQDLEHAEGLDDPKHPTITTSTPNLLVILTFLHIIYIYI